MGSKNRLAKHVLPIILKDREEGHTLFISEYTLPDDFTCVWSKDISNTLCKRDVNLRPTEKLFTYST